MRYWKTNYDEDTARDLEQRRYAGLSPEPDNEMWFFGALVGLQIFAVIVVVLMFVGSR